MKNLIFRNIGLKASAVFLAIVLWFFVTSRGQSEMTVDVPLEFRNIPAQTGIVSSSARTLSITVRGQDRMMKGLRRSDIRVAIDLEKARRGEANYLITATDVVVPHLIEVSSIIPSSVKVRLDEMITRTVKVQPVLGNNADSRHVDAAVSVEPATVKIKGFRSDIRKMSMLKTEPIETADIVNEGTVEVGFDTGGANITAEPETVKVNVIMRRKKP